MKKVILICDDEPAVHEALRYYLLNAGMETHSIFQGDQVIPAWERIHPDLLILDIMMPGMSGTDICARIRTRSQVPIILLTAKGEEMDRLLGFALGADDYIVKPFSSREIVSRIQAIFRRMDKIEKQDAGIMNIGNTTVDIRGYEVRVNGKIIPLSPKEVEIVHLLASNPRQVFSREQLLDSVWGLDFDGDSRSVDTNIKRIRKKMPPEASISIKSVYGVGYKAEVL
ncbi:MAG TPA: DNA-binding response regulator [Clostridiales bacterium]|nr:DNA-binding response regulator [Clostridiales bacterium]